MIYVKRKNITKFEFNNAGYLVGNEKTELLLEIDYKNKTFEISILSGKKDKYFVTEVGRIADGLINIKHGENFAWKFQNGQIDSQN